MPFCVTCNKTYSSLGIARHRAMHRDKRENCTIEFEASGLVAHHTFAKPKDKQKDKK